MAECSVKDNENLDRLNAPELEISDSNYHKVMDPILLEDYNGGEIPEALLNIFTFFKTEDIKATKVDVIVSCIYILMLEYGFVPEQQKCDFMDLNFNYKRIQKLSKRLPYGWKTSDHNYSMNFILASNHLYVTKISCIALGDDLIVNGTVSNIEDARYSIIIDVLSYFTFNVLSRIKIKHLQNLKRLSFAVKESIIFPLRNEILRNSKYFHSCMEYFPYDVVIHISKFLSKKDAKAWLRTCKYLYNMRIKK